MFYTTLNKIRNQNPRPCKTGWEALLSNLGKTAADDEPLSIQAILESNGIADAIWCLRAIDGVDREIGRFAIWCARQVQHLTRDTRSIAALDVTERFCCGLADVDELRAVADAHAAANANDDAANANDDAVNAAVYAVNAAVYAVNAHAAAAHAAAAAAANAAAHAAAAHAAAAHAAARAAQKMRFIELFCQ